MLVSTQFTILRKMLICPTTFLKDETRMNTCGRKVQQSGHKWHAAITWTAKTV